MSQVKFMRRYVIQAHGKQTRNGGATPYWQHCENVALTLQKLFKKYKEGTFEEQTNTILAAYGHDLYEDTWTEREEIVLLFGIEVDLLIESVTNRFGDEDIQSFCQSFSKLSEAALLIKLADLLDNLESSRDGYQLGYLDRGWMTSFLQPIIETQWQTLQSMHFTTFCFTALSLRQQVDKAFIHWREAIQPIAMAQKC
jgi:hypothetical protein